MDAPPLTIVRTVAALRANVSAWREKGQTVALVPTMGALHDGHLSLVKLGKAQADRVIVSVFVNPTQFGKGEDFEAYPRDEVADAGLLGRASADLMYAPTPQEMYPPVFSTSITVGGVSEGLCGDFRPGHFSGVATVVAKLLTQAAPDVAIFGEKDFQQLLVIRRLVRDLDLAVQILGAPIVREPDGLARSSRNAYLSAAERGKAVAMSRALNAAGARLLQGASISDVEAEGRAALTTAGFRSVDYFEVRGPDDLARPGPGPLKRPARILAAAWLGKTRLIDNLAVG